MPFFDNIQVKPRLNSESKGGFACFPSCIAGKLYYQLAGMEATHDRRICQ